MRSRRCPARRAWPTSPCAWSSDEALHELPYSAAARYGLALVHRARGDEAEASRWMDAALKIEPGLADQE